MQRQTLASIILAALGLMACGSPREQRRHATESQAADSALNLQYGAGIRAEEFPYVGQVYGCTSVLIDRMWVITADHCIGSLASSPGKVWVQFGNERRQLDLIIRNPGVETSINYAVDVALGRLSAPIDSITPVNLFSGLSDVSDAIMLVGFGRDQAGLQVKRKGEAFFSGNSDLGYNTSVKARGIEFVPGVNHQMPCVGDSGGAMMVRSPDGQWLLAGVINTVNTPECGKVTWGHGIEVASILPWILEETGIAARASAAKDLSCYVQFRQAGQGFADFSVQASSSTARIVALEDLSGKAISTLTGKDSLGLYAKLYWSPQGAQPTETYRVHLRDKWSGKAGSCQFIPQLLLGATSSALQTSASMPTPIPAVPQCVQPKIVLGGNKIVRDRTRVMLGTVPEVGTFYQWKENNAILPRQRGAGLRFTAQKSATYTLTATNKCGVASTSVRVNVR